MASRSSRGSPASTSRSASSTAAATGRSRTARPTRSAKTCSWLGWRMDSLTALPSSGISEPSTHGDFVARWISSTLGCPANPTPSPASASATTITEAGPSSSTPSASSASADPPWSSSRTSQPGLPGAGFDDAARRYRNWVTASKAHSSAVRRMSAHRTGESGSSFWPTCSARDGDPRRAPTSPTSEAWKRKITRGAVNAAGLLSDDLSSSAAQWATPLAEERNQYNSRDQHEALSRQAMLWQTPQARDWKDGSSQDFPETLTGSPPLGRQVLRSEIGGPPSSPAGPNSPRLWPTPGANESWDVEGPRLSRIATNRKTEYLARTVNAPGLRLNPLFVMWLQGFPLGWVDLAPLASTSYARWATLASRRRPPTPS